LSRPPGGGGGAGFFREMVFLVARHAGAGPATDLAGGPGGERKGGHPTGSWLPVGGFPPSGLGEKKNRGSGGHPTSNLLFFFPCLSSRIGFFCLFLREDKMGMPGAPNPHPNPPTPKTWFFCPPNKKTRAGNRLGGGLVGGGPPWASGRKKNKKKPGGGSHWGGGKKKKNGNNRKNSKKKHGAAHGPGFFQTPPFFVHESFRRRGGGTPGGGFSGILFRKFFGFSCLRGAFLGTGGGGAKKKKKGPNKLFCGT